MNKVLPVEKALEPVCDGMTIMMGGFGVCGSPETLIRGLLARGTRELTVIGNNAGIDEAEFGQLLARGQLRKFVASYVGNNKLLARWALTGEVEIEFIPQGTLAERIRAAGAGISAFYTPTGVGTVAAEGKEVREFEGRLYLLERAMPSDVAMIRCWKADRQGNLVYRKTARNFNPVMATAAAYVVAEAEEIVEPGQLDPELVATPGVYVDAVVQGEGYRRWIERPRFRRGG